MLYLKIDLEWRKNLMSIEKIEYEEFMCSSCGNKIPNMKGRRILRIPDELLKEWDSLEKNLNNWGKVLLVLCLPVGLSIAWATENFGWSLKFNWIVFASLLVYIAFIVAIYNMACFSRQKKLFLCFHFGVIKEPYVIKTA